MTPSGARLAAVLVLLQALPAFFTTFLAAQDPLRETVVVTANATPVPFGNLARTVTVLTRAQMRNLPVRSVPELLRFVSSVEVRSRGTWGVQSDFQIRGAGFGQTLVLVNGIRINNSQSGHHNSDIPVMLDDIDRIEILHGPGSNLHGADAVGGTINIITRKEGTYREGRFSAGRFGLVDASGGLAFQQGGVRQSLAVSAARSSGFTFARDFRHLGFSSETTIGERTGVYFSHLNKEFGANGFYGPSPSREWTNMTFLSLSRRIDSGGPLESTGNAYYRTHGDRFLWDVRRPGQFENLHRTHSVGGTLHTSWSASDTTRLATGGELAADWIRSSNLGDHSYGRTGVFLEAQQQLGGRLSIYPGIRYDHYSHFGGAASPSLSTGWWATPNFKLRSSIGRAFRVPSFTELYYTDPNHNARSDLSPERSWGAEVGADWFLSPDSLAGWTLFTRRERNVIDWIRNTPQERWRTFNIHSVVTRGAEASVQRVLSTGTVVEVRYTYLSLETGEVPFLSKYVLDYSRHSVSGSTVLTLPGGFRAGFGLDHRRPVTRSPHWVADLRLSRRLGVYDLFGECTNLLNARYQEIVGADMPPRWCRVGIEIGRLPR